MMQGFVDICSLCAGVRSEINGGDAYSARAQPKVHKHRHGPGGSPRGQRRRRGAAHGLLSRCASSAKMRAAHVDPHRRVARL